MECPWGCGWEGDPSEYLKQGEKPAEKSVEEEKPKEEVPIAAGVEVESVVEEEIRKFSPSLLKKVEDAHKSGKDQTYAEWLAVFDQILVWKVKPLGDGGVVLILASIKKPYRVFPKELIDRLEYDEAKKRTVSGSRCDCPILICMQEECFEGGGGDGQDRA